MDEKLSALAPVHQSMALQINLDASRSLSLPRWWQRIIRGLKEGRCRYTMSM